MSEIPQLIRLERNDTSMDLSYDDGSCFTVAYDDLRFSCPCAKCSPERNDDESAKSLRREIECYLPKTKSKNDWEICLAFDWARGCSAGIYRYERLWALANNQT